MLDRVIMRGLFRLRAEGLERLPEEGPFVLTPNQVSYLYDRTRRPTTIPALYVYSGSPHPNLRVQVAHKPASGQPRDLLQRPWLLEEVRRPRYNLQPLLRTHLLQRIPVHIDHGKVIAPDNKKRRRRDAR